MKKIIILLTLVFLSTAFAKEKSIPQAKEERKPDSIDLSPENIARGYLKLAQALTLGRLDGKVCELSAYPSEVINLIAKAKNLDSKIQPTAEMDKDLGENLSYRLVKAGATIDNLSKTPSLLAGTTFYGGVSSFYPMTLKIKADGIAEYSEYQSDEKADGDLKPVVTTGKWSIIPESSKHAYTTLKLNFDKKSSLAKTYAFAYVNGEPALVKSSQYKVSLRKNNTNFIPSFATNPFECGD